MSDTLSCRHHHEYATLRLLEAHGVESFPTALGSGLVATDSTSRPRLALLMTYIAHQPLLLLPRSTQRRLLPAIKRNLVAPLTTMYRLGFNHGDLAARNILVDAIDGRVWLVDAEALVPLPLNVTVDDPKAYVDGAVRRFCQLEGFEARDPPV